MTKVEQYMINNECVYRWDEVIDEIYSVTNGFYDKVMSDKDFNPPCFLSIKNLRHCSAKVYETDNFYILRSYFTFIAAIDKRDHVAIDLLRYVYGYTSTSAQHIAKFFTDYSPKDCKLIKYYYRPLSKK